MPDASAPTSVNVVPVWVDGEIRFEGPGMKESVVPRYTSYFEIVAGFP